MTPLLEARDLWCRIGRGQGAKVLLEGVSLALSAGEMIGIIGPNGAGKSTLIRHLSGYRRPDQGVVQLGGRPIHEYGHRARAHLLACLTQTNESNLPYAVRDLVAMGRYPHQSFWAGPSMADQAAIEEAIAFGGLTDRAGQSFATLSGGERQMTMIARIIAQASQTLLLDEPGAGLDLSHEHRVYALLRNLVRQGRGILLALHHLDMAAEYCDRLLLLYRGRLVASGPPEAVLTATNLRHYFDLSAHIARNQSTGSIVVQHVSES